MKTAWKRILFVGLFLMLSAFLTVAVGAETYEADGGSATVYAFPSEDCNRTIVVRCVDESGTLLKTVTCYTKRGESTLLYFGIYGYDTVGFQSDAGVWTTCKLGNLTGGQHCYGGVDVTYHFRTAMSQKQVNATVTMRKFEDAKVIVRHTKEVRYGYNWSACYYETVASYEYTLNSGTPFRSRAMTVTGHHLASGWKSEISGNFTYAWLGKYPNCKSLQDYMQYDVLEPTIEDDLPSFSSYDEAKDGRLWRITNRVITIEYRYSIDKNTIQFNPNGGTGSFSPMTHCYGYTLTLPDDAPTKAGYVFLGWRDSGDGKLYLPGERYVLNGNRTLTAVWSRENYDFAITELSLSATKLSPYGVVTVTVKLANRDTTLSYRGIPVTLLYDGDVLRTRNIDFSAGGVQTLTFTVSVGQAEGEHTVTARVNWADRTAEKNADDNERSATLTVQTEDYAQSVEAVIPNGDYIAGDEVITAFLVYHDGTNDILPSMGNRATLTVYAPDGTVLLTRTLDSIAVPAGKCNLIWFRWTVPDAYAGQSLRLECTVNAGGILPENDKSNNTATVWVDVKEHFVSVTPDPPFDDATPAELPTAPSGSVGRVRWNEWVYADDGFVLKEYTVSLSGTATITPNTGGDILRGGGGFFLTVTPTISGDTANATDAQSILVAFPEFSYRTGTGECRTLEQMPDGRFCFPAHPSASVCVHFLPLGIADGIYTVFLQLSGLWTPAGQVSATVTVSILIAGTVYDGFYIR